MDEMKEEGCTYHQGTEAKRRCRCARIEGGPEVPDFDFPVVGAADDALAVEANATDQLFVPFEYPQAATRLNVPKPGKKHTHS